MSKSISYFFNVEKSAFKIRNALYKDIYSKYPSSSFRSAKYL